MVRLVGRLERRVIRSNGRVSAHNRMAIEARKGQGDVKLTREEFERRLRERFYDPAFQTVERQIADVVDVAWRTYDEYRKSPRKRKAGPGFADPEFEPTDEQLQDLSREAFADVAARHARALELLRERIAALRADVMARMAKRMPIGAP